MKITLLVCTALSVVVLFSTGCKSVSSQATASPKKIVLVAGRPSHGPGDHEFRAGCLLLKKCLDQVPGVTSEVYSNGWPTKIVGGKAVDDNSVFEGADAIFIYADGGDGHPAIRP